MSASGITIISASAGSGKTYRLTQEVTRAIDPSSTQPVPLEGLLAVTFTRKANAELAGRIRQTLVEKHAYDDAMRLPLAYLGTVHSACLRLLQEFALDAGVSPNVDVTAEDPTKLLRQALEAGLDAQLREKLERLAASLEIKYAPLHSRFDWVMPVFDIMELARSNRIPSDALPAMAERSANGFLELLPPPRPDAQALDDELGLALERALQKLADVPNAKDVGRTLRDAQRKLADHELSWSGWAKLTKAQNKKVQPLVQDVCEAASCYLEHPRLRQEIRETTTAIFEAARVGLENYAAWKERRRVVDFVDMLDRAHGLLDVERVRNELARRLKLVVVDEFQDTSPVQLALFVRLHALAQRSAWVGDRKQCIFEYAGADPLLMDSVTRWVDGDGGKCDRLDGNYRSRKELVELCNEVFASALQHHEFTRSEIVVEARRKSNAEPSLPPVGLWMLDGGSGTDDAEAIAEGVRRLLSEPHRIVDRSSGELRDLRPGDVAVLVATNASARLVAGALYSRGVRAALARAGLLGTPEGALADAGLRWLSDDRDTLAAATLDALTGYAGKSPDEWLENRIREVRAPAEAPLTGWRAALDALRAELGMLSPVEALEATLDALDGVSLCARWPDAPQRIANLDALRALAARYEDRCDHQREAATVAGLLRYFDDLRDEKLRSGEMQASDDQHVPTDDGAVVVCTYHRSKGLEWPVVVLASLERKDSRDPFDVISESDQKEFDPANPLAGRWIRYWPWPLGLTTTSSSLWGRAQESEVGKAVRKREDKERSRLLYVGFTRARDHLVLAVRRKTIAAGPKLEKEWLDLLRDGEGKPLIQVPLSVPDGELIDLLVTKDDGSTHSVKARVANLSSDRPTAAPTDNAKKRWFGGMGERRARAPYRISPSSEVVDWPEHATLVATARVGAVERLGSSLTTLSKQYESAALGDVVHAFLGADVEGLSTEDRMTRARRLLAASSLLGVASPESVVRAGDELRRWVESRWPGARWRREVPVETFIDTPSGKRRLAGVIDLLLETPSGAIIVDHKTFPAKDEAAVRARAREYAGQLLAYAHAVRAAKTTVGGMFIHFPVGGVVVEITDSND